MNNILKNTFEPTYMHRVVSDPDLNTKPHSIRVLLQNTCIIKYR